MDRTIAMFHLGARVLAIAFIVWHVTAAAQTLPLVNPRLREFASRQSTVSVFLVLNEQPQREVLNRAQSMAAVRMQTAERRLSAATAAERLQAQNDLDAVILEVRREAARQIAAWIRPSQTSLEAKLRAHGATRVRRYEVINMLRADIPASALAALETDPELAEIGPVEDHRAHLAISVPALGANSLWSYGYTGFGQSVGLLDSGVNTANPAFAGRSIISSSFLNSGRLYQCFADTENATEDVVGHGTHVAGIINSQGSASWPGYLGVAKGLSTLYNLKIGFSCESSEGTSGLSLTDDVLTALNWALTNTPARIFTYSYGAPTSASDSLFARQIDYLVDTYGISFVVSAGNTEPGEFTCLVNDPGIAHNVITVGNWSTRSSMNPSSCVGPLPDGRRKPDIAAPGTNIFSANSSWTGASDAFVSKTGTSMAAPPIAAGLALLRQSGTTDPLGAKAQLINTSAGSPWQPDKGWGYATLNTSQYQTFWHALTPEQPRYYRGTYYGTMKATLVWNRHVAANRASGTLNPLNILMYSATDGSLMSYAPNPGDNVQQASAFTSGEVVVKVKTANVSLSGVAAEPFGLSMTWHQGFSPTGWVEASKPVLSVSCSGPGSVTANSSFSVTCTVSNTGGLPAINVQGPLNYSGSSGGAFNYFGEIPPGGSSQRSWSIVAPASGSFNLISEITSSSFGEFYTATGSYNYSVSEIPTASITPGSGSGPTQTFTGVFTASPNYQSLRWVQILFATATDGGGQPYCFIHYDRQGNGLWLYGDGGFFVGPIAPGTPSNLLQNSLCALNTSGSAVTGSSNVLTVSANVVFKTAGARNIYMRAQTLAGVDTGWVQRGTWTLGAAALGTMTTAPGSGSGSAQTFTLTYPDPPGFAGANFGWAQFLIAAATNGGGQPFCFVHYDRAGNGLWMYSSDVGFFLGPVSPGVASNALNSSACSVNTAGATRTNQSGNLILSVPVTMKAPMNGAKNLYQRTLDVLNRDTGWLQSGTWSIQ